MHTFFINTSGQELNILDEVFDVVRESRSLVTLDCPFATWMSPENGYERCVHKMGEIIDSYKDVTNEYNLVIYVDMIAFPEYSSIPQSEKAKRAAVVNAMEILLRRYIFMTIYTLLDKIGRRPQETLIIFEQNTLATDMEAAEAMHLADELLPLSGMPAADKITAALQKLQKEILDGTVSGEDASPEAVSAGILSLLEEEGKPFLAGLNTLFAEERTATAKTLAARVLNMNVGATISAGNYQDAFCAQVRRDDGTEVRDIYTTSFKTNRTAQLQTNEVYTKRVLALAMFLLRCVYRKSLTEQAAGTEDERVGLSFTEPDWDGKVVPHLQKKVYSYWTAYSNTSHLSGRFSTLGMAPKLYLIDGEELGIDEYGKPRKEAVTVDVDEDGNIADTHEDENESAEALIFNLKRKKKKKKKLHKESVLMEKEPAYTLPGYVPFDATRSMSETGEPLLSEFTPTLSTSAEEYKDKAQKLRGAHLSYLDSLHAHVSKVLAHYSGRSVDNEAALLGRRRVSVGEIDYEAQGSETGYKTNDKGGEANVAAAEEMAQTGFINAQIEYFEYYASRMVALTDIAEQCNWFIDRVEQIKESLGKLKKVYFGLLATVCALYAPYLILQWHLITESLLSIAVGLCSTIGPLALLSGVYIIVKNAQRFKYVKAWREFKEKSEEAIRANDEATRKYDSLLRTYIPKLRQLYDFLTDVTFYKECCKLATAKLEHHKGVQKRYHSAVKDILEDLERSSEMKGGGRPEDITELIDLDRVYCAPGRNEKFYSVFTKEDIESFFNS